MIKKGFVLAAGKGERMRPLTNDCPKPLIEVAGRAMLDRALDSLAAAGVEEVVINLHYLGGMIEDHLRGYDAMKIIFSHEYELLETGGGVKKALHHFGGEPFYVLNGDVVCLDGPSGSALLTMARKWNPDEMDILLLLHAQRDIPDYEGPADYWLPEGSDRPVFAKGERKVPGAHVFGGTRIVHPRVFDLLDTGFYSFRDLLLSAEAQGRLAALEHDGAWHHVGTPAELERTNTLLSGG